MSLWGYLLFFYLNYFHVKSSIWVSLIYLVVMTALTRLEETEWRVKSCVLMKEFDKTPYFFYITETFLVTRTLRF